MSLVVWLSACKEDPPLPQPQDIEQPLLLRRALRQEAPGCWDIADDTRRAPSQRTWWLPLRMRLDTALAVPRESFAKRKAWRFDRSGALLIKDVEGFTPTDYWGADSTSERIVVSEGNYLWGATLVFLLPREGRTDTLRGQGQEYSDVYPHPDVPIVDVIATRVACPVGSSDD